jgi:hypothetical protein
VRDTHWYLLTKTPYILVLIAAVFVLMRYRDQARRATTLGFIACFGLAIWLSHEILYSFVGVQVLNDTFPLDDQVTLVFVSRLVFSSCYATSIVLLYVAIVSSLNCAPETGPAKAVAYGTRGQGESPRRTAWIYRIDAKPIGEGQLPVAPIGIGP